MKPTVSYLKRPQYASVFMKWFSLTKNFNEKSKKEKMHVKDSSEQTRTMDQQ